MPHETLTIDNNTNAEASPANHPEFNGGSFTINYLSPSPDGFQFVTDETIPKTNELVLEADDRQLLKGAAQRELVFNNVAPVQAARKAWAEDRNNPELRDTYYRTRAAYQNKGKKIGLRNIHVEGDTLHADAQIVHFYAYNLFGTSDQGPEKESLSRLAGVAMAVRTADNRLIVQHRAIEKQHLDRAKRTRGNASYNDIPGASVAGLLDATIESPGRRPGMPDPIDTSDIQRAILKEAGEELGLGEDDFTAIRIAGVAVDHVKVHDEILLVADTSMTAAEVYESSRQSVRNKNLGDSDFEEKFVDIEASPEAIGVLLTEVHCPLPPTHAATLVAAGYSIALQTGGQKYAAGWRDQVQEGIRNNYAYMDERVSTYYQRFPEALTQVPERFWGKSVPKRNPTGYTPAYGPTEQGLPTFEDEMVRTGLVPETRESVPTAYLFDVDGPLSDPHERMVVEDGLFDEIIGRLETGAPIGLNSGRSIAWLEQQVISQLVEKVEDKSILERLVVIGEKGGSWLTFDAKGEPTYGKVESISIPEELAANVNGLVAGKYANIVGDLDPKETMLSLEMLPGYDLSVFRSEQGTLVDDLQRILQEMNLDRQYKVDPTTIAVDIESPYVGKDLGADRFLQHLADLGLKPEHIDTFGDSASDAAMTAELVRRGHSSRLIYVGPSSGIAAQPDYPVVHVGDFSQGTLRYLQAEA